MDDDLRKKILSESERFGLPVRCSRDSVDVCVKNVCDNYSVSVQFPLVAHLQESDAFLSSSESVESLGSFRRLYELFSRSCASRVQGVAGDTRVSLYYATDGVHVKYKIKS